MQNLEVIVLAAGEGKRMKSHLPKALLPVAGKPLLMHLLDAVSSSRVSKPATIVINANGEKVRAVAGERYTYVVQEEQLGTGHAVQCAQEKLEGTAEHIMVLYGDMPFMDAATINKLADAHVRGNNVITLGTVSVDDFNDWRAGFLHYGRIVRNKKGEIARIIEYKDATKEERNITEVNPSYYCFNAAWLWENLARIQNKNSQREYYLTDLLERATQQHLPITVVSIEPYTALGANTPEQLSILERLYKARK